MERYRTAAAETSAEQVIERSRFIAHIKPVETREEAEEFISRIRAEYRDATHNVPAMVLGEKAQLQWASDDGEPQGTSGAPIVQLLTGEGLTNLVIVVTRYFGGIKLGTGGLVRAYTSSARLALEAAGICSVCEVARIRAQVEYTHYDRISRMASDGLGGRESEAFVIADTEYGEKVVLTVLTQSEDGDWFVDTLQNLTSGTAVILSREEALEKC